MITTEGKTHIKRYLAGYVPTIGESIALGIGNAAETLDDDKLQFEIDRADVILTAFDFVNNRLVFKAVLPEDLAGVIHEVALYSTSIDEAAGQYGSKLLASFDSDTEEWINVATNLEATFNTSLVRVGADSLRLNPSASTTMTAAMQELFLDLSGHSASDVFAIALNVSAVASSIRVQFHTDATNYYTLTLPAQTTGYKFVEMTKSSATATGTPNWANITEIRVSVTAGGTAANIDFDGIRIEDMDTINTDYVLVSRRVLTTPYTRQEGKVEEIEFTMDINV